MPYTTRFKLDLKQKVEEIYHHKRKLAQNAIVISKLIHKSLDRTKKKPKLKQFLGLKYDNNFKLDFFIRTTLWGQTQMH